MTVRTAYDLKPYGVSARTLRQSRVYPTSMMTSTTLIFGFVASTEAEC